MRFGRYRAPAEEPWNDFLQAQPTQGRPALSRLAPSPTPAVPAAPAEPAERELFVRHARKDGNLVAMLRAVERGSSCIVEAEVSPEGTSQLLRPGPYTFADSHQASAFVTEAVEALMYLGCDVQAT